MPAAIRFLLIPIFLPGPTAAPVRAPRWLFLLLLFPYSKGTHSQERAPAFCQFDERVMLNWHMRGGEAAPGFEATFRPRERRDSFLLLDSKPACVNDFRRRRSLGSVTVRTPTAGVRYMIGSDHVE